MNEVVMFYDFWSSKGIDILANINIDTINVKIYRSGCWIPALYLLTNDSNIKNYTIINSLNDNKLLNIHNTLYIYKNNTVGLIASSMFGVHEIEERIKERLKEIIDGKMEITEEYDGQVKVYNEW